MKDFHGWEAGALWEDIKFDVKHFRDIERLAMVGERKWEKGMSLFCKPFTTAEIRYFERGEAAQAREWLEGGVTSCECEGAISALVESSSFRLFISPHGALDRLRGGQNFRLE